MTDNVQISSGTGTYIATDDVGGIQYQRVKVAHGTDGSATDTSSTNPLPVTLAYTGANSTPLVVSVTGAGLPATQSGTWTVNIKGNAAATLDATVGAGSAPTNMVAVGGLYNSTEVAPTTGQSASLQLDSKGRLKTTIRDAAGNDRGVNIDASNRLSVTVDNVSATNISNNVAQINGVTPLMGAGNTGTGSPRVTLATDQAAIATWGKGATGSAVPSGAQYAGLNAQTSLPSAATAGNLTGATADKFGRQLVLVNAIRDIVGTQTTTISASTSETTIVTAVASTFCDLFMLVVSNTSSATNTRIDFRDTTAGSVLFSLQSNGGQPPIGFTVNVPIPQTSVNTNWTAQCATSTTDVRVYACFIKNK